MLHTQGIPEGIYQQPEEQGAPPAPAGQQQQPQQQPRPAPAGGQQQQQQQQPPPPQQQQQQPQIPAGMLPPGIGQDDAVPSFEDLQPGGMCCVVCVCKSCHLVCDCYFITTETPMAFLARQPQFTQLRQVLQNNPALLQPILQQIGQSNPRLLQVIVFCIVLYSSDHYKQVISQNQEAFLQLLNNPEQQQGQPQQGGGIGGLPPGMMIPPRGNPRGPPGAVHIQVTEQEKEAIERV